MVLCSSSSLEGGSFAVDGLKRTIVFLLLVLSVGVGGCSGRVGVWGGRVTGVSRVRSGMEKWAVVLRWW